MNNYETIEEKAISKTRKKKPKMKVSGKSVFILAKASKKK
jgi:hypothetical protein